MVAVSFLECFPVGGSFSRSDRDPAFELGEQPLRQLALKSRSTRSRGRSAVTATMQRPHVETLHIEQTPGLFARGLAVTEVDAAWWRAWAQLTVSKAALENWADAVVMNKWDVLAAARTLHIVRTGHDARSRTPAEKAEASRRTMVAMAPVPSSEPRNENVFRVGQILAWLANSLG